MTDEAKGGDEVTWFDKQKSEAEEHGKKETKITFTKRDDGEKVPGLKMDNRGCTDILCCVLFIAWIVAMAAISIYSFANGSTDKLAYKYDMSG